MSLIRQALETRAGNPENPATRLTGQVLVDILENYGSNTVSGRKITPETAMKFVAVYRSVTLLSGLMGSIPMRAFIDDGTQESLFVPVLEDPAPGMNKFIWRELVGSHLLLRGNFDALRVKVAGNDTQLLPYQPGRVAYDREAPSAANPSGKLYKIKDDNGDVVAVLTDNEILHIPMFSYDGFVGLSPISMAREAIAAGVSAENFANKLWSSGVLAAGILTTDKRLDDGKARSLKSRWKERVTGLDAAYEIAVMDSGAKFQQLTIPPNDAQFLESREFAITDVARLFGLPPHLLSHQERQTSWGTGIEQHNIGFVVYTLHPVYLARIEAAWTALIAEQSAFRNITDLKVEYQVQGLMRGDSGNRSLFYDRMAKIQTMTPNEIRKLENLPPIEGGDEVLEIKASNRLAASQDEPGDEEEESEEDDDE